MFDETELKKYFLYSYHDEMDKWIAVFKKNTPFEILKWANEEYDFIEFE